MGIMEFFRRCLSEKGEPSSKRIAGLFIIVAFAACVLYSIFTKGITYETADLLKSSFFGACALLGLSSITSVFKDKND